MTSLYLFDSNQDLIKIVPQKDLIQARQKEELQENDLPIDRFTAEYKLDAFKDVEAIHYFAVKDLNKPNQFHMYFLKQPIIHENTVLLEGMQLAYKELKHFIIQEIHPQDRQAEFMMNQALQGTGWRVGYVAETVQASQHFYFMPALEALKVISGLFGIELVFKVEISGQKITDKWVEAYNRRGSRTMKRFTHGSNLLSIKGTIERDNVYTALIGRGRGEETEGGGFGRRITFEEIEWSVANGDPVDKPLGLNYVEIPSATEEYGINMPDGSKAPAMGIAEFQDIEESEELLNAVYDELVYRIRPLVQYETTVADVGDVELGEVVGVHRYDLDLHYETRIFKLTRDYLNPKRTPIELGDKVIESRRDREVRTQKTIGNIDREQMDIRSEINYVGRTADGKNVIHWGNEEPEQARVGDMWFRDHPTEPGIRQRLVFDGGGWEVPPYNAGDLNGVLNGDELNVINLNADSMSGGTLDLALGLQIGNENEPVLYANADGEVQMNVDSLLINSFDPEADSVHERDLIGYLRYSNGVVEIGEEGAEVVTQFANDEWAMVRNGERMMWLEQDVINIQKAHFFEQMQVGNFTFVPRANGSMDLKQVVN